MNRYAVTVREEWFDHTGHQESKHVKVVDAFTAADAVTITELRWKQRDDWRYRWKFTITAIECVSPLEAIGRPTT